MNTDFRLSTSYFTHPKIRRLRRRLGGDGCFAHVGLLSFAALHRPDGRLEGFDAEDIADGSGWEGDAQSFVDTLVELRLLDRDSDGTLSVHDWAEHNTWAAEAQQRSKIARANAQSRWEKERSAKPAPTNPADNPAKSAPPRPPKTGADAAAMPLHMPADASADAAAMPLQCSFPILPSPILPSPILPSPGVAIPNATTPSVSDARAPKPDADHTPPGGGEECRREVVALLLAQGISEASALELVDKRSCEAIRQYLDDFPERLEERRQKSKDTKDPAGLLFRAIQDGWGRPESVKRRLAEEQTRQRAEETRQHQEQRRREEDAARSVGQARCDAIWQCLSPEEQSDIETEARSTLTAESFWKQKADKSPEDWWTKPGARDRLLSIRNALLVERRYAETADPSVTVPGVP